jgi:rubrerythrin
MKAKTFDCVEMKHRGAEKVREQIKGMTLEQELEFWQERSRILKQRQKVTKGESHTPTDEEQRAS